MTTLLAIIRGHWQLMALTAAVFALWDTDWVLPFKLLVVFFHELAHGLAAVLTGGRIEGISINQAQGGLAVTRGGNRFAILTAGYLGSLVIGAGLLIIALRTHLDRVVLGGIGAILLLMVALYMRTFFAVLFCTVTGLVMLGMAWGLPRQICDLVLRVIGLSSIIYVPYDIFDDTLRRSWLPSDAYMLANEIGGTTMFWGALWLCISLAVILACLRYGLGQNSNLSVQWGRRT